MRQRRIKNLQERLESSGRYREQNPQEHKGRWHELFGNEQPIYLEIGCGKGKFICGHASTDAGSNYIGVEGQKSVIVRAIEKAKAQELENIVFIDDYIRDLADWFDEDELAGIYLNFSDPWPKDRHAKRRLTHRRFLKSYESVLKPRGWIKIKTDNDELFDFTLQEIAAIDHRPEEQTRDLHNSSFNEGNITTEYEDKFSAAGKNINYVKIRTK